MTLNPSEDLPIGAETRWTEWQCLNRLRSGVGRSNQFLHRYEYLDDNRDLNCEYGIQQLLECPLVEQICADGNLAG